MSAEDKVTPRPWHASCFQIYADNGDRVAHTGMGQLPPSRSHEAVANAELIVRAVNAHDDLVAALEEIADGLYDTRAPHRLSHAREIASAALAKAKGE